MNKYHTHNPQWKKPDLTIYLNEVQEQTKLIYGDVRKVFINGSGCNTEWEETQGSLPGS